MKLCIVGNSHLAALKDGAALCSVARGLRIDWFGAPGKEFGRWS